jgi:hypothetical protein
MTEIKYETYGDHQFWLEDWYTIKELEELIERLKIIVERTDKSVLDKLKKSGVMR